MACRLGSLLRLLPATRFQDQRENAVTAQLNRQQLQQSNSGYGVETYQGVERYQGIVHSHNQSSMQEQIERLPSESDLSIIE